MSASQLTRRQIWSLRRFDCLLLIILVSFFIYPSYAHILPAHALAPHKHKATTGSSHRKPANFPKDFATAAGVAVVAVVIGTTAICVFAHCWRQILDWGRGDGEKGVVRRRVRKDEEAWFCGADRGLPMPQFDILEPEREPLSLSMQAPQSEIYSGPYHGHGRGAAPVVYARNVVPGSRARHKDQWNNSGATLPSWLDSEDIERPASVAYLLDRP
ncbi:hypothetical protein F4825DRAFT_475054 [Nemania diffusa]|nr:hypothetical protein F4825DRAFT_475054 [Nemania diffusa]